MTSVLRQDSEVPDTVDYHGVPREDVTSTSGLHNISITEDYTDSTVAIANDLDAGIDYLGARWLRNTRRSSGRADGLKRTLDHANWGVDGVSWVTHESKLMMNGPIDCQSIPSAIVTLRIE